jgi:hypothetical protein
MIQAGKICDKKNVFQKFHKLNNVFSSVYYYATRKKESNNQSRDEISLNCDTEKASLSILNCLLLVRRNY